MPLQLIDTQLRMAQLSGAFSPHHLRGAMGLLGCIYSITWNQYTIELAISKRNLGELSAEL